MNRQAEEVPPPPPQNRLIQPQSRMRLKPLSLRRGKSPPRSGLRPTLPPLRGALCSTRSVLFVAQAARRAPAPGFTKIQFVGGRRPRNAPIPSVDRYRIPFGLRYRIPFRLRYRIPFGLRYRIPFGLRYRNPVGVRTVIRLEFGAKSGWSSVRNPVGVRCEIRLAVGAKSA
jgi:hypothetical protein